MCSVPTMPGTALVLEVRRETQGVVEVHRKSTSISYLLLRNKLSQKLPPRKHLLSLRVSVGQELGGGSFWVVLAQAVS